MSSATNACQRPGCAGHYAADGYCDECGYKAQVKATAGPPAVFPAVSTVSAATLASVSLAGRTGAGLGGTGSGATSSGTTSGRSSRGRTGGRGGLGANLVMVPPIPLRDPTTAVMASRHELSCWPAATISGRRSRSFDASMRCA